MAKDSRSKKAADLVGQDVEVKSTVGNPPQSFTGTVEEIGAQGVTLSYEYRGYNYLTLVPWTSVLAIEASTKLDGKDEAVEKPVNGDKKPIKAPTAATTARQ